MKQRLALAAALIHRPRILVLDEPMVGLDPEGALELRRLLRRLAGEGVTIFLSTHSLAVAEDVCTRIGILDHGRLVALGTLDELRARAHRPPRGTAATARGAASLEDVFLDILGRARRERRSPRSCAPRAGWPRATSRGARPRRPVCSRLLLTALFWAGCFCAFTRVLGYFQTIADFGPLLTQRLLVLLFVSFFAVLLISNTVTALTTFYLADDVAPLLAAPVPARRLHHARFVETLLSSSWMVLLFGLPGARGLRRRPPGRAALLSRARSRCSCRSSSSRPRSAC